jgi:hypothetical protein
MPDLVLMLKVMGVSAVAAALIFGLFARSLEKNSPRAAACGQALGLGVGSWLGFLVLGFRPHWPLRDDQDRFLALVFPAFLGVEILGLVFNASGASRWFARVLVAAAAAPVLLQGSSYLSDLAGPGTREWTSVEAGLVLGGLALALAASWALLNWVLRYESASEMVITAALSFSTLGAAGTIMLSGYTAGGQLGLPQAAALAGVTFVMLMQAGRTGSDTPLGIGLGGLFCLIVMGRFFAELDTVLAILLFIAPLSCILLEVPRMRRLGPRLRAGLSLLLCAAIVLASFGSALVRFVATYQAPTSSHSSTPSLQDYGGFEHNTVDPSPLEVAPGDADPISP